MRWRDTVINQLSHLWTFDQKSVLYDVTRESDFFRGWLVSNWACSILTSSVFIAPSRSIKRFEQRSHRVRVRHSTPWFLFASGSFVRQRFFRFVVTATEEFDSWDLRPPRCDLPSQIFAIRATFWKFGSFLKLWAALGAVCWMIAQVRSNSLILLPSCWTFS